MRLSRGLAASPSERYSLKWEGRLPLIFLLFFAVGAPKRSIRADLFRRRWLPEHLRSACAYNHQAQTQFRLSRPQLASPAPVRAGWFCRRSANGHVLLLSASNSDRLACERRGAAWYRIWCFFVFHGAIHLLHFGALITHCAIRCREVPDLEERIIGLKVHRPSPDRWASRADIAMALCPASCCSSGWHRSSRATSRMYAGSNATCSRQSSPRREQA
jgi:hypothetical protein